MVSGLDARPFFRKKKALQEISGKIVMVQLGCRKEEMIWITWKFYKMPLI